MSGRAVRSRVFRLLQRAPLLALALPAIAYAQSPDPSEHEIKAAFLYNFARFTEWADESKNPRASDFVLCIVGKDFFGPALAAIEGKLVHGQPLRVRRGVALESLRDCHMLFVSDSEERRLPAVLKAAQAHPVLTVSDIEGFAEAGGMIGLVLVDKRFRFDVNLAPAHRARLKISSQLLRLARSVSGIQDRS